MMKTLIEIYDERPMENVLATDTFCPETTVFLCPASVASNRQLQQKLQKYFIHRGLKVKAVFEPADLMNADSMTRALQKLTAKYDDCALDITGGSDAALFAAGLFCSDYPLPVFTYSRRSERFYNIRHASFVDTQPNDLRYSIRDLFLMAGAELEEGRDNQSALIAYADKIPDFYRICSTYRRNWPNQVSYIQQLSQADKDGFHTLQADGPWHVHGPHGLQLTADPDLLREFESIGFIHSLQLQPGGSVSFSFADEAVRFWLRDVGSFLELYVWDVCRRTGLFTDLRCSTIVNWDGLPPREAVTNEIDVMAVRGVRPLLLSCKACPVKTEAVNELSILRDRFGGQMAAAAVITTYPCKAVTRRRAMELGMDIIDRSDLENGRLPYRLKALSK